MKEPRRYRKKPVVILAMQWTGDNLTELGDWVGNGNLLPPDPDKCLKLWVAANTAWLPLEVGEWIIKDRLGFYPCNDAVFQETYALEA